MGKKRSRSKKTSNGVHSNVASSTLKAVARDVSLVDKALNKLKAWKKGKNPWVTVPTGESNRQYVRVRANGVYGDPKRSGANIFGGKPADAS